MYIECTKFKTNVISVRFCEKITADNLLKRTLLTYLLPLATVKYNSVEKLNLALEDLYDTKLSVDNTVLGNVSNLIFTMSFVSSQYVEDIKTEAINILDEMILNHSFDNEENLLVAKNRLKQDVDGIYDEKMSYVFSRLFEIYDHNQEAIFSNLWDKEVIDNITLEDLKKYYEEVISTNSVYIYEVSDKQLDYKPALNYNKIDFDVTFKTKNEELESVVEYSDISQAKFAQAYQVEIEEEDIIAFQLFNMMFGGSMLSRLFTNIREKHSMAYSIGSRFDHFTRSLFVYAGVSNGNVLTVCNLIAKELEEIQNGSVDLNTLNSIKAMLKSNVLESFDSQSGIISIYYSREIRNMTFDKEEYFNAIDVITLDDIIRVSAKVKLVSRFVLSGDKNEEV